MVLSKQYNKKVIQHLKPQIFAQDDTEISTNCEIGSFVDHNLVCILCDNIFQSPHGLIMHQEFYKTRDWCGAYCIQIYAICGFFIVIEIDHANCTEGLNVMWEHHQTHLIDYMRTVKVCQFTRVYADYVRAFLEDLVYKSVSFKTLVDAEAYVRECVEKFKMHNIWSPVVNITDLIC